MPTLNQPQLKLYNTHVREKQDFTPIDAEHITMYVCGPTVYNFVHIGNARPVVAFDMLFRVLQRLYPKVTYARNITDVDDKINKTAAENNEPISVLAERYAQAFSEDMQQLNTLTPTIEPRATHTIDEMIRLTQTLISKGHAYAIEAEGEHAEYAGHVLFDVCSDEGYGGLSNRELDDMQAGARVEVAAYKKYAGDFVLWKPSKDGEPGWDSPWGYGRPGWHLECTAMINKHLGDAIDIHGGGQDLIFPHHENESAQGRCAHGTGYVNYWLHNGYINIDGTKMSKSLGNFKTVRELLAKYDGETLRFALLSAHYRSPLNWDADLLQKAKASLDGFYTCLRNVQDVPTHTINLHDEPAFHALLDDLNTPQAISELHQLAKAVNKAQDSDERSVLKSRLLAVAELLGLLYQQPETWLQQGGQEVGGLSNEAIEQLLQKRTQAKADKDYGTADAVRQQLAEAGIELEDTANGTLWTRK